MEEDYYEYEEDEEQPLQDEEQRERRELAEKYDNYGGWCGVLAFVFPYIFAPLALYYGLKARKLDPELGGAGIWIGFNFTVALLVAVVVGILVGPPILY